MTFSTEDQKLPSKEVYLEDKGEALSFPGNMHDEDISFFTKIHQYGKSAIQSLHETLLAAEPIISDDQWIKMGEEAKERVAAIPEFLAGVAGSIGHDVKQTLSGKRFDGEYTEEDKAVAQRVIDPGLKIVNGFMETFVSRLYEPGRALVGGIVQRKPGEDVAADVIRAAVMPGEVPKITGPERFPLTEWEREGGVARLIPRAIAGGIEDVLVYGGLINRIPNMIQNYEINATKNEITKATGNIHKMVMSKTGMNEKEAWDWMVENKSSIWYEAERILQNTKKMYSGVPAIPGQPGEAAKILGKEIGKAAKSPGVIAKAADMTLEEYVASKGSNLDDLGKMNIENIKSSPYAGVINEQGNLELWHGSSKKNIKGIRESGVVKNFGWFAPDKETALKFARQAGGSPDVVRVEVSPNDVVFNGNYFTSQKESIPFTEPKTKSQLTAEYNRLQAAESPGGLVKAVTGLANKVQTSEIPLEQITLSKDVPNFKAGADPETGIIPEDQLKGKYQRVGTGPIVLWERESGAKEVITGRHRLDLARRSGEKTIPAQVLKEADGYTKEMALQLDAEANIRSEKGSVTDYARYFRSGQIERVEAERRGLLSRAKGRSGYDIGRMGSPELYNSLLAGRVTERAAAEIAQNAPGDAAIQAAAIKQSGDMTAEELGQFARTLKDMRPPQPANAEADLFGFDDSAINEAKAISKEAIKEQRSLKKDLSLIQKILENPDKAKDKWGAALTKKKVSEAEAMTQRLTDLEHVFQRPELYAEMAARAGIKIKKEYFNKSKIDALIKHLIDERKAAEGPDLSPRLAYDLVYQTPGGIRVNAAYDKLEVAQKEIHDDILANMERQPENILVEDPLNPMKLGHLPENKRAIVQALYTTNDPVKIREIIESDPDVIEADRIVAADSLNPKKFTAYTAYDDPALPDHYKAYMDKFDNPNVLPSEKPKALFVLGLPGSGKSQAIIRMGMDKDAIVIDNDDAKTFIEEFKADPRRANYVHPEAANMGELFLDRVAFEGKNIVVPKIGKSLEGLQANIRKLETLGYEVSVSMVDIPQTESTRRVIARFFQTGRYVSPNYVRSFDPLKIDAVYATLKMRHKYSLINTNTEYGKKPIIVEEGGQNGKSNEAVKPGMVGASRERSGSDNGSGNVKGPGSSDRPQSSSPESGPGKDGAEVTPPSSPASPSAPEGPAKPPYKERKFVTSIKEELPQLKVSGQYIPRSTDQLAAKARDLIKTNLDEAERLAATGTDDLSIATASELLKHYTDAAIKATDPLVKDALLEKAVTLGNEAAVRLTELGRSVQAASILSRLSPEGQIRYAAKTIQDYNRGVAKGKGGMFGLGKKIPELTKQQAKDIADKFEEIAKLPEGEQKAMKWKALQDYVQDLVPTPMHRRISTLWKAGLLTGLKTHGVNTFSNITHFGTEIAKDIPAAAIDSVASLFTGRRSVALTLRGIPGGVKEGFERGWTFLKTGYDQRNVLDKLDYKRINLGKGLVGKTLQAYEETIFRLLGAEDQVFYYGAKARSLAEQAIVAAKNKGLRGKAKEDFVSNLLENPTDDMLTYAVADAETAVFQNKTALSEGAAALKRAVPAMEYILPFSKTPSAVAMQILNYSPAGAVKTALRNIGKGKFDQRDFSKGMGRAALGTAILWMGWELYHQDKITTDRPTSERKKKVWELEGRKENSILVDGKYRSPNVLGPAGNLLLIGAQFARNFEESGSPTEAMAKSLAGSTKAFTEQTFLTGINAATDALKDPMRYGEKFATGLISSAIPTAVADTAKAMDRTERRVEDIPGGVLARIPFFREKLQPQVDVLGRDRLIKENFLEIMADPTRPLTAVQDPIVQEIGRLEEAGYPISTTQLGDKEGYDILTPEQNTDLWQTAGSIALDKITAFMQMDAYDNMEDEDRSKEINKIFSAAKNVARVEKVMEITEGLQGQSLLDKLSEAKKDKLLSSEVLDLYKKMR